MGVRGIMVIGLATLLLVAGAIASVIVVEAMNTEAVGRVTLERSQYMSLWARYIENQPQQHIDRPRLTAAVEKGRTSQVRSAIVVDRMMRVIAGDASSAQSRDALIMDAFAQRRAHGTSIDNQGRTIHRFAHRIRLADGRTVVLISTFSLEELEASLATRQRFVIGYLIFDFFAVLIFGLYLSRRLLVIPIRRLTDVANAIDANSMDSTPVEKVGGPKELRQLADALRDLVKRLADKNQDLTQSMDALAHAQNELLQAEKLATVGRLSAGVAHEVGNPLAAIMGFLEYLRTEPVDGDLTADLYDRMDRELKRIQGTVRHLLDYSRPSSGERQLTELSSLVRSTVELLSFHQKMTKIDVEISGHAPAVIIERQRVSQILTNLLLNAADAMAGSGRILIHLSETPGYGVVDVTDQGPGVSEENINKIFEPFWSTKPHRSGTGLGLSVSRRLIKDEGGHLELVTSTSHGATFRIRVPLPESQALESDQ